MPIAPFNRLAWVRSVSMGYLKPAIEGVFLAGFCREFNIEAVITESVWVTQLRADDGAGQSAVLPGHVDIEPTARAQTPRRHPASRLRAGREAGRSGAVRPIGQAVAVEKHLDHAARRLGVPVDLKRPALVEEVGESAAVELNARAVVKQSPSWTPGPERECARDSGGRTVTPPGQKHLGGFEELRVGRRDFPAGKAPRGGDICLCILLGLSMSSSHSQVDRAAIRSERTGAADIASRGQGPCRRRGSRRLRWYCSSERPDRLIVHRRADAERTLLRGDRGVGDQPAGSRIIGPRVIRRRASALQSRVTLSGQEVLVAGEEVVLPEVMAEPGAPGRPDAVDVVDRRGRAPEVGVVVDHPAACAVLLLGGPGAADGQVVDQGEEGLVAFAEVGQLRRPVVHLQVDVGGVFASPGRINEFIPDPL